MLLNHPIDYLHSVCVCVCGVKQIARVAKWYWDPLSAKQTPHSSGVIIPNNTPPRVHILAHKNTRDAFGTQMHHTKPGEERATEPGCLAGWSVFTSRIHLGWSMRMGIIITSLGSDSQYWWHRLSQYFLKRAGQAAPRIVLMHLPVSKSCLSALEHDSVDVLFNSAQDVMKVKLNAAWVLR